MWNFFKVNNKDTRAASVAPSIKEREVNDGEYKESWAEITLIYIAFRVMILLKYPAGIYLFKVNNGNDRINSTKDLWNFDG